MANVLIAGPIHEAGEAMLKARNDIDCEYLPHTSVADLDARVAELDAILLRLTPFGAATAAKAKKMKVVARYGVGFDAIDVEALTKHGIPLAVVGEANAVPVAEQALGLMLAVSRQIVVMDRATRSGGYDARNASGLTELWQKCVRIVGFGRNGKETARRCAGFDMQVVVADPYVPRATVEAAGYRYVSDFHEALGEADFVSLHLPAKGDGRPLMGAEEFAGMKTGGTFINVARGALVDEEALVAALTNGQLRGAGLDVTREEPPAPDNPLLKLDNVTLSPHISALTKECAQRMSEVSVQNILDAIDGRLDPKLVVNKEVLG